MSGPTVPSYLAGTWENYEECSKRFIEARRGVSYRVFVEQVHRWVTAYVSLDVHCLEGFKAGSEMLPGQMTPEAAQELGEALIAAADKARALNAHAKGQGVAP
ncbi:hypothetical protein [Delftia deserti]|uniref:Uncharacterized protein n=1 Tax=Delftia deserti TaxID=1651218 RepID=A0ABW5EUS2_9BURK